MRRLTYRQAMTAFFFTACWGVLGFLFLLSPIPGSLGVAGGLIEIWLVGSFVATAISGGLLTLAAINGLFPPADATPPSRPAGSKPLQTTEHAPDAQVWTTPLSDPGRRASARADRR